MIVRKASKSSKNSGQRSASQKRNDNMKKRVIYIIVTDAFCWVPIIIIACFSHTGYEIPAVIHPLSAIVFLPINSVINPIIYSKVDDFVKKAFKKLVKRIQCCNRNREGGGVVIELDNL